MARWSAYLRRGVHIAYGSGDLTSPVHSDQQARSSNRRGLNCAAAASTDQSLSQGREPQTVTDIWIMWSRSALNAASCSAGCRPPLAIVASRFPDGCVLGTSAPTLPCSAAAQQPGPWSRESGVEAGV